MYMYVHVRGWRGPCPWSRGEDVGGWEVTAEADARTSADGTRVLDDGTVGRPEE